ncbi:MAG TPA: pyridoxal-phosphate dependent enzyme [Roseiarcus sp.]|nr:pyridoxal-phosphate dependent enzyme [Roseiarcus sp.]
MPHWLANNSLSIRRTPLARLHRIADPRYIKQAKGKPVQSVVVEPTASQILTQDLGGEALKPEPHKFRGLGAGFVLEALDLSLVDAVEQVSNEAAALHARRLASEDGVISGVSCGAAAVRLARRPENARTTIVVVPPDSGERYLTTALFEGLFDAKGLAA